MCDESFVWWPDGMNDHPISFIQKQSVQRRERKGSERIDEAND